MSKKARISQRTRERCLLTEIAPYETPMLFSNWGSYNYCRGLSGQLHPNFLKTLFSPTKLSIPFKYRIKKDAVSFRTLSLVHPHHSKAIVDFYQHYDVTIIRACKRSPVSLRAPHHVAKFYLVGKGAASESEGVEEITAETAYASSYFAYSRYSHLHKFFDSDDFTELEKKFSLMCHLDVTKCFPSLYTHSISWAVRGKTRTKKGLVGKQPPKKTFDAAFDELLQGLNYRETHGIPIGPELCRIFAEVILQKVDACVIERVAEDELRLGEQYWYYRYIDDYYLFYNEEATRTSFVRALSQELEVFKLYLNDDKSHATPRPFISALSVRKLEICQFIDDLAGRREELDSHASSREIDKLRALTRHRDTPFSGVSTYLLSALAKQIRILFAKPPKELFNPLYVLLDLAFHAFRMDIRVATSFKIAGILLDVMEHLGSLAPSDRAKVTDKLVFELRGAFESAIFQGSSLECMNVLIANAPFSQKYPLPVVLLEKCVAQLRSQLNDEYSEGERLSYFEIVSLLYYCGNEARYRTVRGMVYDDAKSAITAHDPREYSETAHLLLDLVSCPILSDSQKDSLIHAAMSHENKQPVQQQVAQFRNYVSKQSWYFNWSQHDNLRLHLKKKQLLLAY
jgi:hypothetical protein